MPTTDLENVTSEEQILSDFPFYGTVLSHSYETGKSRFLFKVETNRKARLSELARRQFKTGGDYFLQYRDQNGVDISIPFSVEPPQEETPVKVKTEPERPAVDPEILRQKIKEEIRGDYSSRIQNLEADLNRYSRENSELRTQLSQIISSQSSEKFQLAQAHNAEIQNKLSEIATLRQELAIAKLRAELSGAEPEVIKEDESTFERILKLVGPYLGPVMQQFQQQAVPAQSAPVMKAVALPQPVKSPEPEPQPEDIMPNLSEALQKAAIELSNRALSLQQPSLESVKQNLELLSAQVVAAGYTPTTQDWIAIAHSTLNRAVDQNATPEKVARIIGPMVTQIEGVTEVIELMPSGYSVGMLQKLTGITLAEQAKQLLTHALDAYKTLLKAA